MSVAKTAGRGVAWTTASLIIGKAIIFINVFLILHNLSVYEYGFTELIMSIISTIGIVLLPGLTNTIIADLVVAKARGDKEDMNRVFHQFLYLNLTLGTMAWAALFFGSHSVAAFAGNAYVAQFLVIISFTFLIAPLRTMTQILATIMLRFFDQSFYGVIEEICKCLFLLIFVVGLHMGVQGLMYSMVLSQFAVVLILIPRTLSAYRRFSNVPAKGRERFWELLGGHRKWSIGASYVGTLAQNVRIWIIKIMLGTEAVGLFAFSYGILTNLTSLLPLASVITPIVPRYVDKKDQLIRILRASIKLQLILSFCVVFCVFAFGHLLVTFVFTKYTPALPLVYILSLTLFSNSIVSLFIPVFATFREQKSLLFSNVFKLGVSLFALPLSILAFGILGPAVEIVITTLANSVERYVRLRRILPAFTLPFRDIFSPDAYEREAMQTVLNVIRVRFLGFRKE